MVDRIPDVLSGAMGNQMYVAVFPTKKGLDQFYQDVLACEKAGETPAEKAEVQVSQ
jgi:hypothetical protein